MWISEILIDILLRLFWSISKQMARLNWSLNYSVLMRHTWTHPNYTLMKSETYIDELVSNTETVTFIILLMLGYVLPYCFSRISAAYLLSMVVSPLLFIIQHHLCGCCHNQLQKTKHWILSRAASLFNQSLRFVLLCKILPTLLLWCWPYHCFFFFFFFPFQIMPLVVCEIRCL